MRPTREEPVARARSSRLAHVLALAVFAPTAIGAATQRPGDAALYRPDQPGVTVYVTYNGFHSDLDVPTAFLEQGPGASAAAVAQISRRRWTALGWGDAVFYQGKGFGPARALALLHSALWPRNRSVVHLAAEDDPLRLAPGWRALRLTLSAQGAEALRRRLNDSFALNGGQPVSASTSVSSKRRPEEMFFRSRENAWAFHVCNHWTAELLTPPACPSPPCSICPPQGCRPIYAGAPAQGPPRNYSLETAHDVDCGFRRGARRPVFLGRVALWKADVRRLPLRTSGPIVVCLGSFGRKNYIRYDG